MKNREAILTPSYSQGGQKAEGLEALGLGYRTGLAEVQAGPKR